MGYQFSSDDIMVDNPRAAGEAFTVRYVPTWQGPDQDSTHQDHVQVWGSDGTVFVDEWIEAAGATDGAFYEGAFEVPALEPGYYDVAINLPDDGAAGATIIVE